MIAARMGLVAAFVVVAAACSDAPLALANIQTGRSLNQDGSIANISTQFKPNETIYVSVQTTGAAPGTISVQWKYQGRVIDEPSKQVDPSGPVSTSFQLQNSARFPEGDYSVDIFINGQQVGSRNFRVLD
jgi:photosystem II stability/assembly factor-like uncharacterized protein